MKHITGGRSNYILFYHYHNYIDRKFENIICIYRFSVWVTIKCGTFNLFIYFFSLKFKRY